MTSSMNRSRRDFLRAAGCLVATGGVASLVPKLDLLGTALAQSATTGYRALVCVYLGGGNDSWNLLIPTGANTSGPYSHSQYAGARNGYYTAGTPNSLAIPNAANAQAGRLPAALPLANTNGNLGINPFAPELAQLYDSGRLAFLANVGTLREPLTRATFNARQKPPQLYSHNDQTSLWHIGSSTTTQVTRGFGGMVAGYTANTNSLGLPPAISIAGSTRYLVGERFDTGQPVFPFQMSTSSTTPATALANYNPNSSTLGEAQRRQALIELLDATYPSVLSGEYADIANRSLALSRDINAEIASLPASGNPVPYPANNSLADQLRTVARMIRISRPGFVPPPQPVGDPVPYATINANRQVFYVSTGGYDTHDGQITSLGATGHHLLLQRLSQAINWFQGEMAAIGAADQVVMHTMSDFARTINSNGNGTDHAWGGVQMIVGGTGAVAGGNVFGRYPRVELNVGGNDPNGESMSRGQFIPTLATDQVGATLARWMGVDDGARLLEIFPNLDAFTSGPNANAAASPSFAYFSRIVPGLLAGVA